ncbi:MAG: hypothetical protein WDO17_17790 [Alphaproteobacteria bacterium]
MKLSGQMIRAAGAAILSMLVATGALAQAPIRIFDSHLHYNQEPNPFYEHTGFSTPPGRVRELLDQYPGLMGELSYRGGITEAGKLSSNWRALFASHSPRFLLGSDTWINERWFGYDTIMKEYRGWLAQLPADEAERIAHGNAEKLFARAD